MIGLPQCFVRGTVVTHVAVSSHLSMGRDFIAIACGFRGLSLLDSARLSSKVSVLTVYDRIAASLVRKFHWNVYSYLINEFYHITCSRMQAIGSTCTPGVSCQVYACRMTYVRISPSDVESSCH